MNTQAAAFRVFDVSFSLAYVFFTFSVHDWGDADFEVHDLTVFIIILFLLGYS